jgi:hypothetical protein
LWLLGPLLQLLLGLMMWQLGGQLLPAEAATCQPGAWGLLPLALTTVRALTVPAAAAADWSAQLCALLCCAA